MFGPGPVLIPSVGADPAPSPVPWSIESASAPEPGAPALDRAEPRSRDRDCSTGEDVDVSEFAIGVKELGSDIAALPSDGRCACFNRADARILESDDVLCVLPSAPCNAVPCEARSCRTREVSVGVRS